MRVLVVLIWILTALAARAEDPERFTLAVDPVLQDSGLMAHVLPRFALKTGRRADPGTMGAAEAEIDAGPEGRAVFARGPQVFRLRLRSDNPAAARFADWILSDAGQGTVAAFVPQTGPAFLPAAEADAPVTVVFDGDPQRGAEVAATHCARCHRTAPDSRDIGIGSTPSFMALRALPDWAERAMAFYALNPHPGFMLVRDLSPPFDPARPPAIRPVELTLDDVADVQAYLATLEPADLGTEIEAK